MSDPFLVDILPQLASGAAHTHALGFKYEGVDGDRVRLRTPWRPDLSEGSIDATRRDEWESIRVAPW